MVLPFSVADSPCSCFVFTFSCSCNWLAVISCVYMDRNSPIRIKIASCNHLNQTRLIRFSKYCPRSHSYLWMRVSPQWSLRYKQSVNEWIQHTAATEPILSKELTASPLPTGNRMCAFSNHEGILTALCIWALWSQRDERPVCGTLRSIISCSSCTMSSLRLSCRVDILCSSSSLRCLTEETSCTMWWYQNVTSAAIWVKKKIVYKHL